MSPPHERHHGGDAVVTASEPARVTPERVPEQRAEGIIVLTSTQRRRFMDPRAATADGETSVPAGDPRRVLGPDGGHRSGPPSVTRPSGLVAGMMAPVRPAAEDRLVEAEPSRLRQPPRRAGRPAAEHEVSTTPRARAGRLPVSQHGRGRDDENRQAVERPLGTNLLDDPDERVDTHTEEERVLPREASINAPKKARKVEDVNADDARVRRSILPLAGRSRAGASLVRLMMVAAGAAAEVGVAGLACPDMPVSDGGGRVTIAAVRGATVFNTQ
jgi:hypothetical protein